MATIVTRSGKGSPLTNNEVDANFNNLNTDKLELGGGTLTGNLSLGDNVKLQLGNQTNGDLQIYHDGSNSYIDEQGTGSLNIRSSTTLRLQNASGTNYLYGTNAGEVVLYHNGYPKLATTSTGIDVTGSVVADGFQTDTSNTNFNLLARNSSNTAVYIQNGGSGNILDVQSGSMSAGQGTSHFRVANDGAATFSGSVTSTGLTLTGATGSVSKVRFQAEEVHGDIEGINIGANFGGLAFKTNTNGTLNTALTIDSSQNATFSGSVSTGNMTLSGQEIDVSSGDFTLDVAGKINLDHGSPEILLKDDGTHYASFISSNTDFVIQSILSDKDMLFKGQDGSSTITALTLDMSNAGAATFNAGVTVGGNVDFGDLDMARFGVGNDLQIFHNGTENYIKNATSDQDFRIQGNDGGNIIDALIFDMSAAGAATFNSTVTASSYFLGSGNEISLATASAGNIFLRPNGQSTSGQMQLASSGAATFNSDVGIGATPNTYSGYTTLTLGSSSNGGIIDFERNGTIKGEIFTDATAFGFQTIQADDDIVFKGNDGGSTITALTLDMSDAGTAIFNHDASFPDGAYVKMGAGADLSINSDGTNGRIFADNGNLTLDVAGDIILDADSGSINFKDGGVSFGSVFKSSSNMVVYSSISNGDMKFMGNDGGSNITASPLICQRQVRLRLITM